MKRIDLRRWCWPLLGAVLTGCIPALANQADVHSIPRARIIVMPPAALVYSLDASDNRERQTDASKKVSSTVSRHLRAIAEANGVKTADGEDIVACSPTCVRLMRWGVIASLEIGLQKEQIRNYGMHSVADWRFSGDLAAARDRLEADYALLTVFKQTRETTGRRVLLVLSGS